ncbi:proton-conducting transporter membrane subunit [Hippea alviniae]|uniref:proton-conducting transporter transmembrane domain-containing protein n=1 Tax=Hippea alviniae TaxID=1279027 RepID=UPI0003B6BF55|nr:proton-conducting transporter membrane subunit [Hippea alviniae]
MRYYYLLPMLFPFLASVVSLSKSERLSEVFTAVFSLSSVLSSVFLLFVFPIHSNFFYIDGFSKIMLVVVSVVYLSTALFSITYLKHVEKPLLSKSYYYMFLNLFVLTMLFSVSLNNLGLLWVGIEATTITSALLVAIDNDEASLESSWRYIIVVSVGLVMSLIGVMLIYAGSKTLYITKLLITSPVHPRLFALGAAFTVAGFATKAGIFPMHTWLPDVHGRAIAPVSAIFSGVLLPVALFGVYRIIEISCFVEGVKAFALVLGVLTVGFASVFLVSQKFYKRMFAYSSMENMGMILIGLALGNKFALLGAVVLIVAHAFAKSSAFYTTGNILSVYKTRDITEIRGLSKVMPIGAYNLVLSSLAVTGAPPFANFVGEALIIYAVYLKFGLFLTVVLSAFLTLSFFAVNYKVVRMSFSISDRNFENKDNMALFIPVLNTLLAFFVVFAVGFINTLLVGGMIK